MTILEQVREKVSKDGIIQGLILAHRKEHDPNFTIEDFVREEQTVAKNMYELRQYLEGKRTAVPRFDDGFKRRDHTNGNGNGKVDPGKAMDAIRQKQTSAAKEGIEKAKDIKDSIHDQMYLDDAAYVRKLGLTKWEPTISGLARCNFVPQKFWDAWNGGAQNKIRDIGLEIYKSGKDYYIKSCASGLNEVLLESA